jgi:hypothetical protein
MSGSIVFDETWPRHAQAKILDLVVALPYVQPLMSATFPPDWPKPCPPEAATPAAGRIYRRTKKKPPSDKDLQTHHQKGTGEGKFSPCGRCGLSVLTDETDLEHSFRLFEYQGAYVFRADVESGHGQMMPAGGPIQSHTNVWFHEGVDVRALFSFDREIEK